MSRIPAHQIIPPKLRGGLDKIKDQVQEYLRMPSQEEFDALVQAGWEREEAHFEMWSAQLRRERARQHEDALLENDMRGSIAGYFGE